MTTSTTSTKTILLFGSGSLGANTAMTVARRLAQDVSFLIIDDDRIERKNLANQPWFEFNVGQNKATVLAANLWHLAKSKAIPYITRIQHVRDVSKICGEKIDLGIDCFDNPKSRKLTQDISELYKFPILHSGFSENTFLCKWGNASKEFFGDSDKSREPVCDRRELAVIVQIGSALTCEAAYYFLTEKKRNEYFLELWKGDARLHNIK